MVIEAELGDLLRRQEELDAELVPHVRATPTIGGVLHHPLIISIMFGPALHALTNAQFRAKKAKLAERVAKKDHAGFVFLHERPYRLDALEASLDQIGAIKPRKFWKLVAAVWTDSENICEGLPVWRKLWSLDVPEREAAMTAKERAALSALPDVFEVYRGVNDRRGRAGLSWTIDRQKALWFANRWDDGRKTPEVISGTVSKSDVLAHFTGRNEKEIVVLPELVRQQRVERARTKFRANKIG